MTDQHPWCEGQVLGWAHAPGVFAYLASEDDPVDLGDGIVTEDGWFWLDHGSPEKVVSLLTGGLCTSYDEQEFDWVLFSQKGVATVKMDPKPRLEIGQGFEHEAQL